MRYLIFLIFSISLISDEGDIVERKILDTEIYKKNLKSFCRPKLKIMNQLGLRILTTLSYHEMTGIILFPMVFMMEEHT